LNLSANHTVETTVIHQNRTESKGEKTIYLKHHQGDTNFQLYICTPKTCKFIKINKP